jgi:hypothetical protein
VNHIDLVFCIVKYFFLTLHNSRVLFFQHFDCVVQIALDLDQTLLFLFELLEYHFVFGHHLGFLFIVDVQLLKKAFFLQVVLLI